MPRKKYKCKHCGEEHDIYMREDYDGKILYTVCPNTNRGVMIENK